MVLRWGTPMTVSCPTRRWIRCCTPSSGCATTAVSSGAIATTASWTAKTLLFLIAIPFAAGNFHAPSSSGDRQTAIWIVLAVVLAAGIAVAVVTLVPRLRRLASSKARPVLGNIWTNVKAIATEPRQIAYSAAGSVLAQLLVAAALGASLHAVGQQASLATILVVMTLASIIGGAVPVPGGLGVIPLALEEPDPQGEHADVAGDQRGEGVGGLQRQAPAVGQLAGDRAVERPGLGGDGELGEHEGQRHPSPAGALDDIQRFADVGEDPDDRPDADQRADAEDQVDPADPFGLGELGHLDARLAGYRGA